LQLGFPHADYDSFAASGIIAGKNELPGPRAVQYNHRIALENIWAVMTDGGVDREISYMNAAEKHIKVHDQADCTVFREIDV